MKNLALRTLTGTIYVALIVGGIFGGAYTFLCLFAAIVGACLWEFYELLNKRKQAGIRTWLHCFGGILMFVSAWLFASGRASEKILSLYVIYLVLVWVIGLYSKRPEPITRLATIFLGQVYIALPFAFLNSIAFSNTHYEPVIVLALFVFIWVNDTFAYLVGVNFGKRRMCERISPKKSWEGFWGGLFATLLASQIFAYSHPGMSFGEWLAFSFSVVLLSVWGDLIESLFKRSLNIKDSGKALPGHGGFLDRFDSIILAVYAGLVLHLFTV